jgi:hypothetical protein
MIKLRTKLDLKSKSKPPLALGDLVFLPFFTKAHQLPLTLIYSNKYHNSNL